MNKKQSFYETLPEEVEKLGYNNDKIQFILDSVGTNLRVLEIGCNDGFIGSILLKNGNDVYGIDIVRREVIKAKKRGIKAKVVDIENQYLPYASNFFDVVLLTDVIEHVFDTDVLLAKIYKVLKPGGTLLVTTPNVASLGRRLMLLLGINPFLEYSACYIDYAPSPAGHIRYYTHSDLSHQLERNNFHNVITKGDRINFMLFSSIFAATLFPSFSINIHCRCIK
jgi:2-polyprenyl-3-methyl-5-hydroxy-6-metoxy-1,4-benzoquinol methylase